MVIRQNIVVTIVFAGSVPFMGNAQPDGTFATRRIRLVESRAENAPSFTLSDGDKPESTLSMDESDRLQQLIGQIEVKAPWRGYVGFDGTDYELTLLGEMSSVTFRWWEKAPAEWERVGMVLDYVLELAGRS